MNIDVLKRKIIGKFSFFTVIFFIGIFYATGCQSVDNRRIVNSEKIINPGDKIIVDFTCRLKKDGKIVVTTEEPLIKDNNDAKSIIFYPIKEYVPIPVIAGEGKKTPDFGTLNSSHKEILENISMAIIGKEVGVPFSFDIMGETSQIVSYDDRYLKISRIREKPRIQKINLGSWKKSNDRTPLPGDVINNYHNVEGLTVTVLSVDDNQVEFRFDVKEGTTFESPLGKAFVYEDGDNMKSIIDYKPGQLLRSGPIVGRVIDVTDTMVTFDYGHPFGGEVLSCEAVTKREEAVDEKE